jgi:peptidoglycan/xylan/chitin deacetylase (PgdA/CDA1 family)
LKQLNITFHGVGAPPGRIPQSEQPVWVDADDFEAALDRIVGHPNVRVTFDDGNDSDVDVALPALLARRLTATFFVVVQRIGEAGYLGREDLRELIREGMQIGSHGMAHCDWRTLDATALNNEVTLSRRELQAVAGGARVWEAACPFGSYDRRVVGHLRRAGYQRVFTSDGGWAKRGAWLQTRNTLRNGHAATTIESLLRGPSVSDRLIGPVRQLVKRSR